MFGRRRAGTISLVGAQQVLSVFGALTLANVLKDLIFWTDMIRTILGEWAEFVQTWLWPVAAFLFGWAFELLQDAVRMAEQVEINEIVGQHLRGAPERLALSPPKTCPHRAARTRKAGCVWYSTRLGAALHVKLFQ